MKLHSEAFGDGELIPRIHSHRGGNKSPQLSWSGAPTATRSFALICDDPDAPKAGGWVHWVLWNIPSGFSSLPEALDQGARLPDGICQGLNDWRESGWDGPEPPSGIHHYHFRIFALDRVLDVSERMDRQGLEKAMEGHILAQAELVGLFPAR